MVLGLIEIKHLNFACLALRINEPFSQLSFNVRVLAAQSEDSDSADD